MPEVSPLRMPAKSFQEMEWHKTAALNPTSIYEGASAEKYMEKDLLLATSGAGTGPVPGSAHYGAAKAGTKFALTHGPLLPNSRDIRINAVAPG